MKHRRFLFIHIGQFRLIIRKSVVLGMFILAIVLLFFSKSETPAIQTARGRLFESFAPVIHAAQYPFRLIGAAYDGVIDVFNVYEQNKELKKQNDEVLLLKAQIKALKSENEQLGKLLHYTPPADAKFKTAKVMAVEGDGFSHSLIIYLKNTDQVKAGQAVLGNTGIVGRIESVGQNYARVILLTDINSKIPVILAKSRTRGILSGDNTLIPKLIFTPLDAEINLGDELVTSGTAGFFPADLPIGRIKAKYKSKIEVETFDNIEKLEYVKIVDYGLNNIIVNDDEEDL